MSLTWIKASKHLPIGVFDSGLGGLTVVKELLRHMPGEDIVYFGDTARVPYGTKSPEAIVRFSHENVRFLLAKKVKMIIVACNSSSSFALESLRASYRLPIMGVIVPGAQKAVRLTKKKIVGVIATGATIHSGQYTRTIHAIDAHIKVISQACPLFVPLAEEGWQDHRVAEQIAREYLKPLKKARVDVLILGCTHYPLLRKVIQKVMGPQITLVDSAQEIAQEAHALLTSMELSRPTKRTGACRFFVSDKPQQFQLLAKRFLGRAITPVRKIS